jgi:hypothetical protein
MKRCAGASRLRFRGLMVGSGGDLVGLAVVVAVEG